VALLLAAALGLDFTEVLHGFLELAGEPLAVKVEELAGVELVSGGVLGGEDRRAAG
jgi:hypothetical protein